MTAADLSLRLNAIADPERAQSSSRFFKTGPGESGEGLRFLGLNAAQMHGLAKEFGALPFADIETALRSAWHDERAVALLIMVRQFPKADAKTQKALYDCYLANRVRVNSWALVDCSAPHLVGAHLFERSRKPLDRLARSASLWGRRIAMVATQHFIRKNEFADTLRIAKILLGDEEDLIHKAVGWMLREVGDRDMKAAEAFLRDHCGVMPRTMLRYAIEKFPPTKRKAYLAGTV
jgi:3-methyladenine DNA glycosylase AlkD